MNYKMIGRFFSAILAIEAAFMLPAIVVALIYHEPSVIIAYTVCIAALLAVSALFRYVSRGAKTRFYAREGLVCVGLGWLIISAFGALPFVITKEIPNFIDAFFEIVSGFTTTGASILTDVEAMSKGLLYWRSFSHWIGGMGVLVFMMAFLSDKGKDTGFTVHILRAESPGPEVAKLLPHMRDSSIVLYGLYIALTVLDILFLLIGKMPVFDAFCIAFGTAGTGGFGVRADSLGSYSPYLQTVTTVFMLLFGVNFNLYFLLILRRFKDIITDAELHVYLGVVAVSTALISFNILGTYTTLGETIHHAAFQVATIITTTGYSTANFDTWPSLSKAIMLTLMVIGACAGSTGGGIKCSRVLLMFRAMKRYIRKVVYPSRVEHVRVNNHPVSENTMNSVSLYLVLYAFILVISFLIISIDNFSVETNISAVLACFNNIGPGFGAVGPMESYAGYSWFSKIVLTFDMLAGRLELLPILALLSRRTWNRR
ncbi:MAG: TrkH family potassium uptake protein [Lachnospiraceae bacterium]|nr:TrkH family potassium uptake protein [Lachnospiraceae bacterium]